MSEWKEHILKDIGKIVTGKTPPTKERQNYDGDIPFVCIPDLGKSRFICNTNKTISNIGLETVKNCRLPKGSVVVSCIATIGQVGITIKEVSITNQQINSIIPDKNYITSDFCYYYFKNMGEDLAQFGGGGSIFEIISKEKFSNITLSIPPLPEQTAIASVLSSLDDKIDLLHRQNETLEKMAQTLFRQWFVEEAKEEWEVGKLSDEFEFVMGASPPGDSYNEEKNGVPLYQGNADFGFRFPVNRVFTTNPKRFAEKFDTLISVRAPVGEQNMAIERCCIGRGVAAFRFKQNNSFNTYTYYKIKSLVNDIKQFNETGTVFGSISKSDFIGLDITIPDLKSVSTFQTRAKPIDDKILTNTFQILTLTTLRDTLLPKLMSGEVKISV